MRLAVVLAVLALGAPPSAGWHTFRTHEITVRLPPGWHATARSLTPVDYPKQALALGSYALPHDSRGADGCRPTAALDRLPATGAFVFAWEYARPSLFGPIRSRDFPRRPTHFKLMRFAQYECLGPSYMIRFREAGRFFQVHVAFGRRASAATRTTALHVLDGLEVR
jgi:hypothetical protein